MAKLLSTHVGGPYAGRNCYNGNEFPRQIPRPDVDIYPSSCIGGQRYSGFWTVNPNTANRYNELLKAEEGDFMTCLPISMHRWLAATAVHILCPVAGFEFQLQKIPLLVNPADSEVDGCKSQEGFMCKEDNWQGLADLENAEAIGDVIKMDDAIAENEKEISWERDPTKFAIGEAAEYEMNDKTYLLGFKVIKLPEDGLCSPCAKTDIGISVHALFDDHCFRHALSDGSELVPWEICSPV